jgi:hypothetical protein
MCRTRPVVLLALALLVCAPQLFAYDVALRSGAVIHFKNCRVVNRELLYIAEDGTEKSVLLSDINFERTRELNASAYPPLDLDGWIKQMNAPKKAPAATPSQPLGDVARELHLQGATDPQGHVFTDDDFPKSPGAPPSANASSEASPGRLNSSSSPGPSTAASDWAASKAKIEQFLQRSEGLKEQQYAAKLLGPGLADVQFPKRSPWQTQIYAVHKRYVDDAKLCISDRISDEGWRQNEACARLDSDKSTVQTLRAQGQSSAQEWKTRQDAFVPH